MNNINSSSLFHFTKELDTLKKILVNGLRYSFAYEQYSKEIVNSYLNPDFCATDESEIENGVAIPMISFCDIPITRAWQHIEKYGQYMIGLNKTNFSRDTSNIINPVIYIHSPNLKDAITLFGKENAQAYCKMVEVITHEMHRVYNKTNQEPFNRNELEVKIKSLVDQRFYSNFLVGLVKPIGDEKHYYYDEREWRLFLPEHTNGVDWIWGISDDYFLQNKEDWNNDLGNKEDMFIKIPYELFDEYITHIVVSKDKEVDELITLIMNSNKIFGYENDMEYSRMKLISKITSFERIGNDY